MLPHYIQNRFQEQQRELYTNFRQNPRRAVGLVVALQDVFLETVKKPLMVIESVVLIIVNLGKVLAWHKDSSGKELILCLELTISNLGAVAALPVTTPLRLILQIVRTVGWPQTANTLCMGEADYIRTPSVDNRPAPQPPLRSPPTQPSSPVTPTVSAPTPTIPSAAASSTISIAGAVGPAEEVTLP